MFKRMMEDTLLKTLGASVLFYLLIVGFAFGLVRTISWWLTGTAAALFIARAIWLQISIKKTDQSVSGWLVLFSLIITGYLLLLLDLQIGA